MSYRASTRRSRSPIEHDDKPSKSRRSRSPHASHHASTHKRSHAPRPVILPFQASPLSKLDFGTHKPMFGLYLDIQKQLIFEELPHDEVRGRWKSFLRKWNHGELAEGWYDPATLRKAQASALSNPHPFGSRSPQNHTKGQTYSSRDAEISDDDVGPALPGNYNSTLKAGRTSGPAIPNLQDLELQRELANEDSLDRREVLHQERLQERKQQKERLEDLVPRAEAGSKSRMLEKKREKADNNRAFASAKTEAGGVEDVAEADLLGDDGGIDGFKKQKKEMERKKNEREIRREEILRARQVEREQRVKDYKAKEEKTMSGLVALAKAKYG